LRVFAPLPPMDYLILGKVKGIEGFIMAAGHEGDGVALLTRRAEYHGLARGYLPPITGDLIAELVVKDKTSIPLSEFK